jgi:hypothetical protein
VIGGTKFANGKLHILEYPAGVILLCHHALLVGHTIFGCADKIVSVTNYLND